MRECKNCGLELVRREDEAPCRFAERSHCSRSCALKNYPYGSDRARFEAKFERPEDGCWEWQAVVSSSGYGTFWVQGRKQYAHRYSYELHVGPIPDGLFMDHLCRNTICINPAHLEPVTPGENVRRGIGPAVTSAMFAAVTHCTNGHPRTEANVYMRRDRETGRLLRRICRPCRNAQLARKRMAA